MIEQVRSLISGDANVDDVAAGLFHGRCEGVTVRIGDLTRLQAFASSTQLVASRQHQHARTTDASDRRPPGRCDHADEARSNHAAGRRNHVAQVDVAAGCAHARSRLNPGADLDLVVRLARVLDSNDGIGAVWQHCPGHDAQRGAWSNGCRWGTAGPHLADDLEANRRSGGIPDVARQYCVAVHRGVGKRRHLTACTYILGQDVAMTRA